MKNVHKLGQQIAKSESILNRLKASELSDGESLERLELRRGQLAVAALAENSLAAQSELDQIDKEQWKLERRLRDSKAATANETERLEGLRAELAKAQKELDCCRVRELINSRVEVGKRIEQLALQFATELHQRLAETSTIDSEISGVLSRLDPDRLGQLAAGVKSTPQNLTIAYVRHTLKNIIGSVAHEQLFQPGELKSMDIVSKKFFVQLGEAMDALPDGTGERTGRLYQALSTITGLKGHTLNPGDTVRLSPGDAKDFIEIGALVVADELGKGATAEDSTIIPQENDEPGSFELQPV